MLTAGVVLSTAISLVEACGKADRKQMRLQLSYVYWSRPIIFWTTVSKLVPQTTDIIGNAR